MKIAAKDLCFAYGRVPVLKNLSFCRSGGQVVALLGENGSGKSTLLSCLAGLRAVSGIEWDGKAPACRPIALQAQYRALVSQHSTFDPAMRLYDFVLLGRKPWFKWHENPKDHQRVQEMLELFELTHLAFRCLSEISGGERQKAMLARAFAQDTPLLLLDEPLNNLDLRFQVRFMNILKRRSQNSGKLILAALHDINVALNWCDSAILLKDGGIVAEGSIEESIDEKTIRRMLGVRTDFFDIDGRRQMLLPLTE